MNSDEIVLWKLKLWQMLEQHGKLCYFSCLCRIYGLVVR